MTDIHRADSARVQPPGAAHDLDELSTVNSSNDSPIR